MPAEGKKSTAADLRAAFPEAAWLAGPQLHQTQRQIAHRWLYLEDPSAWQKTLLVRQLLLCMSARDQGDDPSIKDYTHYQD